MSSCASCKTADLFQNENYCQRCYSSLYSRIEDLQSSLAFAKKLHEQDQDKIKQLNAEIAELKQAPLFPVGDT